MKIQVLGVGGCFSPELGNSSIIIWNSEDDAILVDCGITVYPKLKQLGIIDKINTVFITHTHGDHIGSLDSLLFHRKYVCGKSTAVCGDNRSIGRYLCTIDNQFADESAGFLFDNKIEFNALRVDHTDNVKKLSIPI